MTKNRPVVLLHGWGGSFVSIWASNGWVEALAERGRTVMPLDLPGHGGPGVHDPSAYADLAGLLEPRLPAEPVDLIGFSLGAKTALALATRHTNRFPRIVLGGVGDNLFAAEPAGEAVAAALTEGIGAETPAPIAGLVRYALANGGDPAALAAILRRPPNPVLAEADLQGISDVLIVNGENDGIARPDDRLRRALPQSRHIVLSGVDHLALPAAASFKQAAVDHVCS